MAKIIAIMSGKEGAGKSTVAANIASCLAASGFKTVVVELENTLRCMDIILGQTRENLVLHCFDPQKEGVELAAACVALRNDYDYVVIDAASTGTLSTLGEVLDIAKIADLTLLVTTPDPAHVRETVALSDFLYVSGHENQRLVINKVEPNLPSESEEIPNLDEIMDAVGIELVGVLAKDPDIHTCASKGLALPNSSRALAEYNAIIKRLQGIYTALQS